MSQNWQAVNCTWQEPFNAIRTRYQPEYRTMTSIARYRWVGVGAGRWRRRPGHCCCAAELRPLRYAEQR